MGANGDAGSATIGSPLHSWAALHADDPVLATWRDDLWLIFDSRPHIGSVDLQVHRGQLDAAGGARCAGVKTNAPGTENIQVDGTDIPSVTSTIGAKLQQDPSIDYVVALGASYALAAQQSIVR